MIITTSICANYLPKAMTLAKSVKTFIPECRFVLCLVEKSIPDSIKTYEYFDEIILAKELWENDESFHKFIFRHTIVEASTAVKGALFLHLMTKGTTKNDSVVYLDPDVKVYGKFEELDVLLEKESIILAPHLLKPGNVAMELSSLKHGVFNLGFLAVSPSENGLSFVKWWAERLHDYCYDDICNGIFTDQKWINLAPCFFDTHILKHAGYDYATWSLQTSHITYQNDCYSIDGDPLRFIHFSGIDGGTIDWAIKKWSSGNNNNHFSSLYQEYKKELAANDVQSYSKIKWSYSQYVDGSTISKKARHIFRVIHNDYVEDPFTKSNLHFLSNSTYLMNSMKNQLISVAKKIVKYAKR